MNEWERNLVKGLFDKFLEGRKGVSVSDLVKIMERLAEDECVLGKVPNCDPEDYPGLMQKWDKNEDTLVSWLEFRNGLNDWPWRMVEMAQLQSIIDDFF